MEAAPTQDTPRPDPESPEFEVDWELLADAGRELYRAEQHYRQLGRMDGTEPVPCGEMMALSDTAFRLLSRMAILAGIRLDDGAAAAAVEQDWTEDRK